MFREFSRLFSKHLTLFATVITAAVCVYIASRIYLYWETYRLLKPNEWGDFFAGAFGPIAFFWLVLGYIQQGTELKNSVEAQKQQAKNFETTIALQELEFTHQRKIFEDELNARYHARSAHFHCTVKPLRSVGTGEYYNLQISLQNFGSFCDELVITCSGIDDLFDRIPAPEGHIHKFHIWEEIGSPRKEDDIYCELVLVSKNALGEFKIQRIIIEGIQTTPTLSVCLGPVSNTEAMGHPLAN